MSDDLMTILTIHGAEVGKVDDTTYLSLPAIYACPGGSAPTFYCIERDWPTMPAARLAALHVANMELIAISERQASEIAQLKQRLTALEKHLTTSQENPGPCPEPGCGRADFKNMAALRMHIQRAHQGMQTPTQRAYTDTDQGWRCAVKGCDGAHTRSLLEPDFCTYHAKPQNNGVETTT